MTRPIFNHIVNDVSNHDAFFRTNMDCSGREAISGLLKCTSTIRQLAYGVNVGFQDEYMQISERTSRTALNHFCQTVMEIYGLEFLRKPKVTDIEKLYRHHEERHGFPGMLGSLDCTDWGWFGCPYDFKAQYVKRNHGPNPFILLEVVASQDLWIWHAFFGVVGLNNDINLSIRYYLVDGIYPESATLVKTIPDAADDDHK
ncbi:ALP1-like protein [Tanacetum coccineum]